MWAYMPGLHAYPGPHHVIRLQALFKKHDVSYDVRPYWICMGATFLNLWQVCF